MFDYIFITHLPSFYKINLYNELSKKLKICVIFVGNKSNIRTGDFTAGDLKFNYHFLSNREFEKRNKIKCSLKLLQILRKNKYKKIVVGGWELLEFWIAILISNKDQNALALESSVEESTYFGIKGFIKKMFLKRLTAVFASGISQKELLYKLNYENKVYITKGVGIINKPDHIKFEDKINHDFRGNFLYVGRLSQEKNLSMLIEVFNNLPQFKLTIVGSGPLENDLKVIAKANISFINHIANTEIYKVYLENDCFILPSIGEPWGLVIEEALYYGLPVIISNKVGCGPELVKGKENGIIFDITLSKDLKDSILKIAKEYSHYKEKVKDFDINKKDQEQVYCYKNTLNKQIKDEKN